MKAFIMVAALLVASGGVAMAQTADHNNHTSATSTGQSTNMPPHAREYSVAMEKMHDPMMKGAMAADPDEAFVRGMIPHHQGAIDMARVVLKYGKDAEAKKMAQKIIEDQEKEIAQMQAWLKAH